RGRLSAPQAWVTPISRIRDQAYCGLLACRPRLPTAARGTRQSPAEVAPKTPHAITEILSDVHSEHVITLPPRPASPQPRSASESSRASGGAFLQREPCWRATMSRVSRRPSICLLP